MKLNTKQKNLLANRAFKLAEIDASLATSRSMDDEARADGMLSRNKEFDKTDLYDAHEQWQKKYLSSAKQFGLTESFLAQLYNYAYDQAYHWEQDGNLVYHYEVTYSAISEAIFKAIANPALISNFSNEMLDQREEGQKIIKSPFYSMAESTTKLSAIFAPYNPSSLPSNHEAVSKTPSNLPANSSTKF